jgi:hypothetical protein
MVLPLAELLRKPQKLKAEWQLANLLLQLEPCLEQRLPPVGELQQY